VAETKAKGNLDVGVDFSGLTIPWSEAKWKVICAQYTVGEKNGTTWSKNGPVPSDSTFFCWKPAEEGTYKKLFPTDPEKGVCHVARPYVVEYHFKFCSDWNGNHNNCSSTGTTLAQSRAIASGTCGAGANNALAVVQFDDKFSPLAQFAISTSVDPVCWAFETHTDVIPPGPAPVTTTTVFVGPDECRDYYKDESGPPGPLCVMVPNFDGNAGSTTWSTDILTGSWLTPYRWLPPYRYVETTVNNGGIAWEYFVSLPDVFNNTSAEPLFLQNPDGSLMWLDAPWLAVFKISPQDYSTEPVKVWDYNRDQDWITVGAWYYESGGNKTLGVVSGNDPYFRTLDPTDTYCGVTGDANMDPKCTFVTFDANPHCVANGYSAPTKSAGRQFWPNAGICNGSDRVILHGMVGDTKTVPASPFVKIVYQCVPSSGPWYYRYVSCNTANTTAPCDCTPSATPWSGFCTNVQKYDL
jgi:hypothetical protein